MITLTPEETVNILLVDDRPDGIFAMEAVLRCPQYTLFTARSGEEALRFFLREDFAVVLLDVQMPGIDGFETARLMRKAQGTNKTPIIFVTAINVEDRYVYAGYETGAVDYIFKPFDARILRSKVAVFVDLYRMNAELLKQAELLREAERKEHERALRQQTEAVLVKAKEAAEEASRAKTRFLANMSHEIRTPLGVVLGFAELLTAKNYAEEDRDEAVLAILRNGRQLLKLIDDFLDISKVEAGKLEVEKIPLALTPFFEHMHREHEVRASAKGLGLTFTLEPGTPAHIATDPTRLRQILDNLVGNAIKFTDQGAVRVVASLAAAPASPLPLEIRVEDTGIGIHAEAQTRLFQDFMQADISTTRRFGGTGLGLALSSRLARLLGGEVRLTSSAVGRGSAFTLAIPAEPSVGPPQRSGAETGQLTPEDLRAYFGDHGLKVLLVEDSCDNQQLVSRMLRRFGAQVTIAGDGVEGVRLALSGDFDLLLMDIQMPHLDGFEATSHLRSAGYHGPIIALTAHAMREERDRCLAGGFDDHLSKPVNFRHLMHQIRQHARPRT